MEEYLVIVLPHDNQEGYSQHYLVFWFLNPEDFIVASGHAEVCLSSCERWSAASRETLPLSSRGRFP